MHPRLPTVTVTHEDPTRPVALGLIRRLTAELAACYPEDPLEGGAGFDPATALTEAGSTFVVAWRDGEPVGCGAIRPLAPGVGEVKRMFVAPEARRQGVSRHILAALEAFSRSHGYEWLRLETGARQSEAIAMYAAAGYARIVCFGRYADNPLSLCFEKSLTDEK